MTPPGRAAIPYVIALLPLAYLIWMCARFYVDVPFWDAWELVPRLDRLDAGTMTFRDFWGQHNEHRPLFPIALMLLMARASGWNVSLEIAANVMMGIGIFFVWVRYLRTAWAADGAAPGWLAPFIAVLVFSPSQWENWTWGWQITALMGTLATMLCLYLASTATERVHRFAGALICAVWSTYSFAAGLVLWVSGALATGCNAGRQRRRRLGIWTLVGGGTIASYFYDYQRPPQPSILDNFRSLAAFRIFVVFVAKYLGGPICAYSPVAAVVAGLTVAVVFAGLAWRLRACYRDPVYLFPLTVGLQAIGVGVIAASGRAWIGSDQALASRYATIAIPVWCATAALAMLLVRQQREKPRRMALSAVLAAALIAVLASAWIVGEYGVLEARARANYLQGARRGLITGNVHLMQRLYPNLVVVKQRRAILRMLGMSVFREH
jgi:hypothetical protein